jgi:hypothetical protein
MPIEESLMPVGGSVGAGVLLLFASVMWRVRRPRD